MTRIAVAAASRFRVRIDAAARSVWVVWLRWRPALTPILPF
jgi:hypothetical protein